ncbi:hypothetical protein LCGC14_1653940 [marine sediment metagenome]|uniref:Uncharacterized protein n=1 Tax=marine sediment metagenome TaxID=412755 RepID=A0A0F9HWS6_9ZZZZ
MFNTRDVEVDGYHWDGAQIAWVRADGVIAIDADMQDRLGEKARDIASKVVLARLASAEAAFQDMHSQQERRAALRWLDVAFDLDLNNK